LNFSRPGAQVIAQYYNFIRLGWRGYTDIARTDLVNARLLSCALEASGCNPPPPMPHPHTPFGLTNWGDYVCCSEIHKEVSTAKSMLWEKDEPERYIPGLPVVSFHLTDQFKSDFPHVRQAAISTLLRVKGWILPNYPLPPNDEKTEILRAVIRESFSASPTPPIV
jgi:glutamate decarboxylase